MMEISKSVANNNPMLDYTLEQVEKSKEIAERWADIVIDDMEEEIEELKVLLRLVKEFQKSGYNANGINIYPRLCSTHVEKEVNYMKNWVY